MRLASSAASETHCLLFQPIDMQYRFQARAGVLASALLIDYLFFEINGPSSQREYKLLLH